MQKKLLEKTFLMGEVKSSPISVFVGHRHLQHAASAWRGEHCIWYHSYLIPKSRDLPDAVASVYENGTALGVKKAAVFLERDLDQ